MFEAEGQQAAKWGSAWIAPSTVRAILTGASPMWAALRSDSDYFCYMQSARRELQLSYTEIAKSSLIQAEKQVPNASYAQALMGSAIAVDKAMKLDGEMAPTGPAVSAEVAQTLDELAGLLGQRLLEQSTEVISKP
jgi:hypothetical protein